MGRSKVTLTIFVGCPCLVNTLQVFLTGIPVIIMSILSFIRGYCMGIACRIPVLVGFGLFFCASATSLTVSMVLGLEGRVVSVLAFFTMVCGMVKRCDLLFWGDVTFRILAAPRCLVIAALISSLSAWVGARPSIPTSTSVFPLLM